jgi:hypothetical protein
MKNGFVCGGSPKNFVNQTQFIDTTVIGSTGQGARFRFTLDESTLATTNPENTPTTPSYGDEGVGRMAFSSLGTVNVSIESSSGYVAFKDEDDTITILASNGDSSSLPASLSYTFWSCASADDYTKSGDITSYGSYASYDASSDSYGNNLSSLLIKRLSKLAYLYLYSSALSSLDISGLESLEYISSSQNNSLVSLKASSCTKLGSFYFNSGSALQSADFSDDNALENLYITDSPNFTTLSVDGCFSLSNVSVRNNASLSSLVLDNRTNLSWLECSDCGALETLSLRNCTALTSVTNLYHTKAANLDVSGCTNLQWLGNAQTGISFLHITGCNALEGITLSSGTMDSLTITGTDTSCSNIYLYDSPNIQSVDLTGFPNFTNLYAYDTESLTSVNVSSSQATGIFVYNTPALQTLNAQNCTQLLYLSCDQPNDSDVLTSINVGGCTSLASLRCQRNTNFVGNTSALCLFYSDLPPVSSGTLYIGENASTDTSCDATATNKGWTVLRTD